MTIGQAIIRVCAQSDAKGAVRIAETLRFRFRMNYREVFEFVSKIGGIELPEWDALLEEGETGPEGPQLHGGRLD